ncbi:hypothetical protein CEXT_119121 [Caerostris extrusa]|uniref:Uncharacterized protein n=1 Tax=Caerostris extrusa TaxID=172846 RepID=A0AAV4PW75_CAEEX|nr:hypothetical protein CEXT_119121 [Caerostris extrusa]
MEGDNLNDVTTEKKKNIGVGEKWRKKHDSSLTAESLSDKKKRDLSLAFLKDLETRHLWRNLNNSLLKIFVSTCSHGLEKNRLKCGI